MKPIGLDAKNIATDEEGNVFFADSSSHRIRRLDASTGIVTTVVGNGTTVFEPFLAWGQILPADFFFQAQLGAETRSTDSPSD